MSVRFEREKRLFNAQLITLARLFRAKNCAHCKQDACAPVEESVFNQLKFLFRFVIADFISVAHFPAD